MLRLRAVLAGCLLFVTTVAAQSPSLSPATHADTTVPGHKSPAAARLIGLLSPGLGHIYAGEVEHGLFYLAATPSLVVVGAFASGAACLAKSWLSDCDHEILKVSLVAAGALWAWSIFDAGRAAQRTTAKRSGRTSLILEPARDNPTAVRLGVRINTW